MLRRLGILALLLSAVAATMAASLPKPGKSKYLVTTNASFLLEPDQGARYSMSYMLRSFPLPDLYVVSVFENPEDPATPLQAELKVEAGRNDFTLNSPYFKKARNDVAYTVDLSIYADEAHIRLLGKHKQRVLFSVPADSAEEVKRRYGVTFY